jgi:hypothetical protein
MERSKKIGYQQDQMEEFHGCPMLQKEPQELSQVSQLMLSVPIIVSARSKA